MDVDVDPFDEHGKKDEASGGGGEDTTGERIPLIPKGTQIDTRGLGTGGAKTRETSFIEKSQREEVKKVWVDRVYKELIERYHNEPNAYHYDRFNLRDGNLYYINDEGKEKRLTKENGELRAVTAIRRALGNTGLERIGFFPEKGVSHREAAMLNKVEKDLPSTFDIDAANDIELEGMTDKSINSTHEHIRELSSDRGTQTGEDDPNSLTMRELEGLDKELRNIRGSLKVEVAKKVKIEEKIKHENHKLLFTEHHSEYDEGIRKDIERRLGKLNEDLKVREESIDLLKGRLKNQITSFKETIAKVLAKDDSTLGDRIRTLFREQGITIFSILTAIGMAIGVLVEALLPGSTTTIVKDSHGGGDKKGDKKGDEPGSAKEWVRNKLKALASLLGKLAEKAGAALPGIIGSVVAWLLNRAKEVVGWVSKNLWSLALLLVWMGYDYLKGKPKSKAS